jgi:hypothetical protein
MTHGPSFGATVEASRRDLLLFRLSGPGWFHLETMPAISRRTPRRTEPSIDFRGRRDLWSPIRGVIIGLLLPLLVLAVTYALGSGNGWPGWITWQWAIGLGLVNCVFLVGGPFLWDALSLAGYRIDEALPGVENDIDALRLIRWIHQRVWSMRTQLILFVLGGVVGTVLLYLLFEASGRSFSVGFGEYFAMFETAALATNGLWILWWIVGLIPQVDRSKSIKLWWHDPARTPAIAMLNRALWKTGFAIMVGMVCLAIAVAGLPARAFAVGDGGYHWGPVVWVQYAAFAIVGAIFVRDAIYGQWGIIQIVRRHIDIERRTVDERFLASRRHIFGGTRRARATVNQLKLNEHFDNLRAVDLNLTWALTWATSVAGAVLSSVFAVILATPS